MSLKLDTQNVNGFVSAKDIDGIWPAVERAHAALENKSGPGSDFLGWLDLPSRTDDTLIDELERLGEEVREHSDCLVSIGIGGSYLGIRSTLAFLRNKKFPVYYAGHNMSADYMHELIEEIQDKRITLVVISKSGTTTEPALAFRILLQLLKDKYSGEELRKRVICVTDEKKGALRKIVDANGYRSFVIPDDVGGRFSILTPVGLVPLAVAGVDIRALIAGARSAQKLYATTNCDSNIAYRYAAIRSLLYKQGKTIEVLSSFYDNAYYVAEWWKQLYGESEGKDGKGIFPASLIFSTDLHSMGQLMQDGMRTVFETFLHIERPYYEVAVPHDEKNYDNFNFVAGKDLDFVNKQGYAATAFAHCEGGVPNMTITLDTISAYTLGELYYFFERGVGISGYLLGVNPFDQPGVEAYKKKMFSLLGR